MKNPESFITDQIKNILRLLRIPFFKHWGGPMGEPGVSDIIGVVPGGRSLFIEVKTPTGKVSEHQEKFLAKFKDAGALAFVARSPEEVIQELSAAGYEPAARIRAQFRRKP